MLLAIWLAMTACASTPLPIVPWDQTAAGRSRPGWPTSAPGCRFSDVQLSLRGENGASGTTTLLVAATNISQHPCLLSGYPTAVATSPVAPQPTPLTDDDYFYISYYAPGDMAPGESSMFTIGSPTSCAQYPFKTATGEVHVELPDGTAQVDIPDLFVGCGLSVTSWYLDKEPLPLALRASLKLPPQAHPDSLLQYEVQLTNTGSTTIDLRQYCPTYDVFVFPLAGLDPESSAQLNCAASPPIRSGHSVVFQMELRLGPSTPHGSHRLDWFTFQSRTRASGQFDVT